MFDCLNQKPPNCILVIIVIGIIIYLFYVFKETIKDKKK